MQTNEQAFFNLLACLSVFKINAKFAQAEKIYKKLNFFNAVICPRIDNNKEP